MLLSLIRRLRRTRQPAATVTTIRPPRAVRSAAAETRDAGDLVAQANVAIDVYMDSGSTVALTAAQHLLADAQHALGSAHARLLGTRPSQPAA